MTAATRRGKFFVTIRDKLTSIFLNFTELSVFDEKPAELVFMRLGGVKEGVKKWRRLRESNPCTSRERAVS